MQMKILKLMSMFLTLSLLVADDGVLHIVKRSSAPLLDICLELKDTLHWRVSYEEAPVLAQDELVSDVAPSGVHWLAMRAAPVVVDIRTTNGDPAATKKAAIEAILEAYHRAGNRGMFKAIQEGDFIHVLPVAARNEMGELRPFQPLLDTPVTIVRGTYRLGELVSEIVGQVSRTRGIPIAEATVPINLFAQVSIEEAAYNEPARDVLVRAFASVDRARIADHLGAVRLTWYLGYSPNGQNYFMNVHAVGPERADPTPAASKDGPANTAVKPAPPGSIDPRTGVDPSKSGTIKRK
jgi:hypothetical protein